MVRAIGTTGDVIVPPSPKERAQAKAAMAKLPAAERSALAQLPRGSKVVSGSLFVLADAPGTGGPRRLLTWALQTVPKGGYPVPSCGPVLVGHRPHCPRYNLRVDLVNALTGKWVMATETSTVVGVRALVAAKGRSWVGSGPARALSPLPRMSSPTGTASAARRTTLPLARRRGVMLTSMALV